MASETAKTGPTAGAGVMEADASEQESVQDLCPDLPQWPRRWSMEAEDLAMGQTIVEVFVPFLHHLIGKGLARKTLRRHRDNLWLLGGELIRRRREDSELDKQTVAALLEALVDDEGGPLIWPRISESAQKEFDATCRKLYRFLLIHEPPSH